MAEVKPGSGLNDALQVLTNIANKMEDISSTKMKVNTDTSSSVKELKNLEEAQVKVLNNITLLNKQNRAKYFLQQDKAILKLTKSFEEYNSASEGGKKKRDAESQIMIRSRAYEALYGNLSEVLPEINKLQNDLWNDPSKINGRIQFTIDSFNELFNVMKQVPEKLRNTPEFSGFFKEWNTDFIVKEIEKVPNTVKNVKSKLKNEDITNIMLGNTNVVKQQIKQLTTTITKAMEKYKENIRSVSDQENKWEEKYQKAINLPDNTTALAKSRFDRIYELEQQREGFEEKYEKVDSDYYSKFPSIYPQLVELEQYYKLIDKKIPEAFVELRELIEDVAFSEYDDFDFDKLEEVANKRYNNKLIKARTEVKNNYKQEISSSNISSDKTTLSSGDTNQVNEQADAYQHLVDVINSFGKSFNINEKTLSTLFGGAIENRDSSSRALELCEALEAVDSQLTKHYDLINSGKLNVGGIVGQSDVGGTTIIAKTIDELEEIQALEPSLEKIKSEGVNVSNILRTIIDDEHGVVYQFQETMPGKGLKESDEYLQATDEQVLKLLSDIEILNKNGIYLDFNGDNILYDPKNGFSFIDLSVKEGWDATSKNVLEYFSKLPNIANDFNNKLLECVNTQKNLTQPNENGLLSGAETPFSSIPEQAEKAEEAIEQFAIAYRKFFSSNGLFNTKDGIAWFGTNNQSINDYLGDTVAKATIDLSKVLMVDANGSLWDDILFNGKKVDTDWIANYAKELGYLGVQIKNVKDNAQGGNILGDTIAIFNSELIKKVSNEIDDKPIVIEKKFKVKPYIEWTSHKNGIDSQLINDFDNYSSEENSFANDLYGKYFKISESEKTLDVITKLESGIISLSDAYLRLDEINKSSFHMPTFIDEENDSSLSSFTQAERDFYEATGDIADKVLRPIVKELEAGSITLEEAYKKLNLSQPNKSDISIGTTTTSSSSSIDQKIEETERLEQAVEDLRIEEEKLHAEERSTPTPDTSQREELEKTAEQASETAEAVDKIFNKKKDITDIIGENNLQEAIEQGYVKTTKKGNFVRYEAKESDLKRYSEFLKAIYEDEINVAKASDDLNKANEETAKSAEKETNALKDIEQQTDKTAKGKKKVTKANNDLNKANEETTESSKDEAKALQDINEVINAYKQLTQVEEQLKTIRAKQAAGKNLTPNEAAKLSELTEKQEQANKVVEKATDLTDEQKNAQLEYQETLKKTSQYVDNYVKQQNKLDEQNSKVNENSRANLILKTTKWLEQNTKISHDAWIQLNQYIEQLHSVDNITGFKQLAIDIAQVEASEIAAGRAGKNFVDILKQGWTNIARYAGSFGSFYKVIDIGKRAFNSVRELDTALIDLKKTTTMSSSELDNFYYSSNKIAKEMGVTTEEIINQASAFSRLGYATYEEATQMAELSSKFASISPDMDVSTATDGLVSVMKAFEVDVDDVERKILDNINRVGNTAATSNGEIVDMLMRSSSAMKEANNTLEETIALETAAVEITRSAETTGTAFKTISMRMESRPLIWRHISKQVA